MELSDEEGRALVRIARDSIDNYVKEGRKIPPPTEGKKFSEKAGVFVTINKLEHGEKALRGCIGFPYPDQPLIDAVIDAGVAAATEDPRFPPLSPEELDDVVVEVSVLTPPELITVNSPTEYPSKVKVGEDGLIVRWAFGSGLLLPQVPVEYKWDAEEFLSHTCMKAGAMPDLWLSKDVKIYRFRAIIFEELEPRGRIERKKM